MRVQELDPEKRYIISVNNDNMTWEDVLRLKAEMEKHCLGAVIICGEEIEPECRYFGLYCEQCRIWWTEASGSRLVFYPAPELANAHLRDKGWFCHNENIHLWQVQEFGKEEFVSRENLAKGAKVCPVLVGQIGDECVHLQMSE